MELLNKDRKNNRRKPSIDLSTMMYGKVPPQAKELEEAVLGAIMLEKTAFDTVIEILKPECFYVDAHQRIYNAFKTLADKSMPIDLLTVVEELKFKEELDMVGGPYYITKLTNSVVSSANIETHARIVLQKFIQRELIRISGEIIGDAYEDSTDVFDLMDDAEEKIFQITNNFLKTDYREMSSALAEAINRIDELRTRQEDISGIPSGFPSMDRVTYGWQKTDLIILAARPAVGKTAFALNLARNAALNKIRPTPVAVFSLEMSAGQLVQRILSAESEIMLEKISRGKMEDYEYQQLHTKGIKRLESAPIYIDDTAALNIFEFRAKARRLVNKHKVGLIIIDYLQLMSGSSDKNGNREQEISTISRNLKALAKELQIPIIALSQLSRAVETRKESKMPQLSDLRECVTGDTLVWLATGERVPVKDLVGKSADVFCINQKHQITTSSTELVWSVGRKPVYEVKLASGRVLKATAEHKILCLNEWKTINDVQVGERIAVTRHIPESVSITSISRNKLLLLAHLTGDGSYLSHQPLRYTTASEANSEAVKHAAEEEFGTTVNRHEYKGTWHQLVFSGNGNRWHPKGLNEWLRSIGVYNQRSFEKKVPAFIFTLSTDDVCFFLKHLWATDGTIYTNRESVKTQTRLAFSTNSIQLANDVAALFLRIEIVARIRTVQQGDYKPMYSVDISGSDNQLKFADRIGAFGDKKNQLAALVSALQNKAVNTNVDTLPVEVFTHVKGIMREKNISQRSMAALRGTAYGGQSHFAFAPSRQVLNHYADILEDDDMKRIAASDIFWDKVVSVTYCGEEEVYDLTVKDTHNWIANEGIITHNSGAIEQDADMVMFIYRPEYYEQMANEQGESTRGETHIRIAKHRNGSLETIKLRALLHIQKFEEWDGDSGGFGGGAPQGGNWKPLPPSPAGGNDNGSDNSRLFIQKGSRMNDGEFDEGFSGGGDVF